MDAFSQLQRYYGIGQKLIASTILLGQTDALIAAVQQSTAIDMEQIDHPPARSTCAQIVRRKHKQL
jgi:hypothetical protein